MFLLFVLKDLDELIDVFEGFDLFLLFLLLDFFFWVEFESDKVNRLYNVDDKCLDLGNDDF